MDLRGFAVTCALGGLVLGGTGGCLLFTDTFNQSPQVGIDGPDEVYRGQPSEFTATVVDEGESSSHGFDWGVSEVCPTSLADAAEKRRLGTFLSGTRTLKLGARETGGCVFVIVTDAAGAQTFAVNNLAVKTRQLAIRGPASVERGKPATFAATFVADDGISDDKSATAKGRFTWGKDRMCEAARAVAAASGISTPQTSFPVDPVPKDPFCLTVIGKDEFGADSTADLQVTNIINHGPVAAIRVLEPEPAARKTEVGLFTEFRLSGADAQDLQGGVTLTWTITVNGQALEPKPCPMPAGMAVPASDLCFSTDLPGMYKVALVVTEDGKVATAPPLELMVQDTPPCIRQIEPAFLPGSKLFNSYDQQRVFGVLEVSDDGDPVPFKDRANRGEFFWSYRLLGEQPSPAFTSKVPFNFPVYTVPARQFLPGDLVEVRVMYLDRQDLSGLRDQSNCKNFDQPRCELVPGSGCFQRITWTVEYQ